MIYPPTNLNENQNIETRKLYNLLLSSNSNLLDIPSFKDMFPVNSISDDLIDEEDDNYVKLFPPGCPHKKERLERRIIDVKLYKLGLYVKDIIGDGNCLMRAICDQMRGNGEGHVAMRKQITDHIEANLDHFAPFLGEDYENTVKEMKKIGVHVGHEVIQGFLNTSSYSVIIHTPNSEPLVLMNNVESLERQLHLSYHNQDHYCSVRKIGEPNPYGPANVKLSINSSNNTISVNQNRGSIFSTLGNFFFPSKSKYKDEKFSIMVLTPATLTEKVSRCAYCKVEGDVRRVSMETVESGHMAVPEELVSPTTEPNRNPQTVPRLSEEMKAINQEYRPVLKAMRSKVKYLELESEGTGNYDIKKDIQLIRNQIERTDSEYKTKLKAQTALERNNRQLIPSTSGPRYTPGGARLLDNYEPATRVASKFIERFKPTKLKRNEHSSSLQNVADSLNDQSMNTPTKKASKKEANSSFGITC